VQYQITCKNNPNLLNLSQKIPPPQKKCQAAYKKWPTNSKKAKFSISQTPPLPEKQLFE